MESGTAEVPARLLGEGGQPGRAPRLGVEIAALTAGGIDLGPPVHVDAEPAAVDELLFGLALVGSGHIGGGDGQVVDGPAPSLVGGSLPGSRHRGGHP